VPVYPGCPGKHAIKQVSNWLLIMCHVLNANVVATHGMSAERTDMNKEKKKMTNAIRKQPWWFCRTIQIWFSRCQTEHKVLLPHDLYNNDMHMKPSVGLSCRSPLRASAHGDLAIQRSRLNIEGCVFFCRGTKSVESTTERVKNMPIVSTVQAQG